MITGMTMPGWSLVFALKSLQNAMMLTPCWPSAGPTGGAGFAWPAGICNLICPVIFFAIFLRLEHWKNGKLESCPERHGSVIPLFHYSILLAFLHLPILQFHRRIAPKNVHRHLQLTP